MTRLRMRTIRAMSPEHLEETILDSQGELAKLRVDLAKGTQRKHHGKIKPLRRDIARMLTRQGELRRE
ncbi:MAG: 50S ribosomal protein L29 [Cenarchaeum sp. SB0665_bin_23]|nr:50S ribosomal protein L29 [Cenarchaeum sp. SB0667_bin_13]MXY37492.1 50S ribosomal protein L29 [Cenarchaeum sp. SB0664_bin_35]MXY61203.1 50S ribosomal protein L29 [Cenarchaeum sp. SB0665_bin_23]MXZ93914.1 50S ribosomal protein L29 [Cenarchaeum sp. SB0666_bin_15]MYB46869.1 50S ribosomal protein L29 [Cenarchaeum sp. SB0662_bin_33]MYC80015.1 50S ribosomal protein L29 [Cenarchaeum sp. SB0661_bin_35]MYD59387.1 50S ribosomal protein L29 [Cenarchaeum sp. SB0678_bin_8]MYG33596.1 50S ribosomal prot